MFCHYRILSTPENITNIERYDEKYDKVALNHLKAQIIREIKNDLNLEIFQNDLSDNGYITALYKNEIDSLNLLIPGGNKKVTHT